MAIAETLFSIVAEFVLIPILAALLIYIGTEIYSKKSGKEVSDEFHKMSFILAAGVVITWVLFAITPANWMLPFRLLSVKYALGFVAFMFTLHYLIYWVLEILLSENKNTFTLGIAAGLVRSKIAITVLESAYKDNSLEEDSLMFSVLLSGSIMVLRNILIVAILGAATGLFSIPPNFFLASMGLMALLAGVFSLVFYKKIGEIEDVEFTTLPLQGVGQFFVFFLFFYLITGFIVNSLPGFLNYIFSAFAGAIYGYVQFFVNSGFMVSNTLPIITALIAVFVSSAFSLLSDIGHAYLEGDMEIVKKLSIPIVLPVLSGLLTLIFLV